MGGAHHLHERQRCWKCGIVGEVGGEDDVVVYQLTREKCKEVSYVLLLYPIYVSDVSFFSVVTEICVGPQNQFGTEKMSYTNTNHK